MNRAKIIILGLCFLMNIQASANDLSNETKIRLYAKLVGKSVTNPLFLALHKQIDLNGKITDIYEGKFGNFTVIPFPNTEIDVDSNIVRWISVEKVEEWGPDPFPAEWGIRTDYKQMRKTDRYYPKPIKKTKYDKGINIKKEIGDLAFSLTYNYRRYPGKNKEKLILSSFYIRCKSYPDDPNKTQPNICKKLVGENGLELGNWLCENVGKPANISFLKENFYKDDESKDSDGRYLSFDGTTILKVNHGRLARVVFHIPQISTPLFPKFDNNLYWSKMKYDYPQFKKYNNNSLMYTYKTDNLKFMLDFTGFGTRMIISARSDTTITSLTSCVDQIPFIGDDQFLLTVTKDSRCDPSDENVLLALPQSVKDAMKKNMFEIDSEYEFSLKQGKTAVLIRDFQKKDNYCIYILTEEGVETLNAKMYSPDGKSLIESFAKSEETGSVKLSFSPEPDFLNQTQIARRISMNFTSVENPESSYKVKILIYHKSFHNILQKNLAYLQIPEEIKNGLLKNYYHVTTHIDYLSEDKGSDYFRFPLYKDDDYVAYIMAEHGVERLYVDLSDGIDNIGKGLTRKGNQNYVMSFSDRRREGRTSGRVHYYLGESASKTKDYGVKIFVYSGKHKNEVIQKPAEPIVSPSVVDDKQKGFINGGFYECKLLVAQPKLYYSESEPSESREMIIDMWATVHEDGTVELYNYNIFMSADRKCGLASIKIINGSGKWEDNCYKGTVRLLGFKLKYDK